MILQGAIHMKALVSIFATLLANAGVLAGVTGLIWLGTIGYFWYALVWLVTAAAAPYLILGWALQPSHILAALAMQCRTGPQPRQRRFMMLGLAAQLYTASIILIWSMTVLFLVLRSATPRSELPLLFLAFAVATGPWEHMISFDKPPYGATSSGTILLALSIKLACLLAFAYLLLVRPETYTPVWLVFSAPLVAAVCWATLDVHRATASRSDQL